MVLDASKSSHGGWEIHNAPLTSQLLEGKEYVRFVRREREKGEVHNYGLRNKSALAYETLNLACDLNYIADETQLFVS
jgi:hypothetical protein